jgi:hypothetical protein
MREIVAALIARVDAGYDEGLASVHRLVDDYRRGREYFGHRA